MEYTTVYKTEEMNTNHSSLTFPVEGTHIPCSAQLIYLGVVKNSTAISPTGLAPHQTPFSSA